MKLRFAVIILTLFVSVVGTDARAQYSREVVTGNVGILLYDPHRHLLYISQAGQVARWDVRAERFLSPWLVAGQPYGLALTPDGSTLYATQSSMIFADETYPPTEFGTGIVYSIDVNSGTVTETTYPRERDEDAPFSIAIGPSGVGLLTTSGSGSHAPLRFFDSGSFALESNDDFPDPSEESIVRTSATGEYFLLHETRSSPAEIFLIERMAGSISTVRWRGVDNYGYSDFDPGSDTVLASGGDLHVFDLALNRIHTVTDTAAGGDLGAVIFLPGEDSFAVVNTDMRAMVVYDTNTARNLNGLRELARYPIAGTGHLRGSIEVSSDGRWVFMRTARGFAYVDRFQPLDRNTGYPGQTFDLIVRTRELALQPNNVTVDLGAGINIDSITRINTQSARVTVTIQAGAAPGNRDLTVTSGSRSENWTAPFAIKSIDTGATRVFASILPSSRSGLVGAPITVFGSLVNAGTSVARNCGVTLNTEAPVDIGYSPFNASRGHIYGNRSEGLYLSPGEAVSVVIDATPTASFPPTDLALSFDCENTDPAPSVSTLNTLLLSGNEAPTPDLLAISATLTNNGIVQFYNDDSTEVFSAAAVNVGSPGSITIEARGLDGVPVVGRVCETDPNTGRCNGGRGFRITRDFAAYQVRTFGVFLTTYGEPIRGRLDQNRVVLTFSDADGVRGSTSVAVQTPAE